jgi:hypothetical protein
MESPLAREVWALPPPAARTQTYDARVAGPSWHAGCSISSDDTWRSSMIRKLKSGEYRLYSRKKDAKTGKRKNLGTFRSLAAAKKHERAVQYFKRA